MDYGFWPDTGEGGGNLYYNNAILLTGITGILTIIPCLYFFRKDRIARIAGGLIPEENSAWKLRFSEGVLVLLMGAAFSQFANMLVALLQTTLNYQEYQESMDQMISGKSLWFLILCMGVIAPVAEEIVFRWLIYLRLRDYMSMGLAAVDLRSFLWCLSWESGAGSICRNIGNCFCTFS